MRSERPDGISLAALFQMLGSCRSQGSLVLVPLGFQTSNNITVQIFEPIPVGLQVHTCTYMQNSPYFGLLGAPGRSCRKAVPRPGPPTAPKHLLQREAEQKPRLRPRTKQTSRQRPKAGGLNDHQALELQVHKQYLLWIL